MPRYWSMPMMFVNGILMFALPAATTIAQAPPNLQVRASPSSATGCGDIIPPSGLPTAYPGSLQPQDVETENQIRNTLGHYPLAIDGKNFDALDLIFTEDAVANYSAPLNVLTGLSQIQLVLQKTLEPVLSQHAYSSQVIEIEDGGETAKSVTYFTASQFGTGNKTGKVYYSYGQYQDNLVKANDGWRIKHRNLVYMGPSIGDISVFL